MLAAMDVKGPAVAFTVLVANVPLPKVKIAHPPGAGDQRPAGGGPRLCLRRRCKGRGADRGECRAGRRQGADRKRAGLRPVHRREGRGADGRGQEVHRADGAAAAHRNHPDRSRDRSRLGQDHREGDERPPAARCGDSAWPGVFGISHRYQTGGPRQGSGITRSCDGLPRPPPQTNGGSAARGQRMQDHDRRSDQRSCTFG
jgi:hypothetical protein